MIPATPSPRRHAFKRFSDLKRHASGTTEDGKKLHGIPFPPLYYKKHDEEDEINANKAPTSSVSSPIKESIHAPPFVFKTPEKTKVDRSAGMSSSPFANKNNTFVPVDRPPLSRITGTTSPHSPLAGKRLTVSAAVSPAPSLVSLACTEDNSLMTTPSTTTSYLQAASFSPYLSFSSQHRHSGASPAHRSVGGRSPSSNTGSGAPLSPRKSPIKYFQHQRRSGGAASPLPYSPSQHHSFTIPYSPGASSNGSHSTVTNADDAARKQRVKTELCMHYTSGRVCPFGTNCTYAHGEAELQMTKLMDMQSAGLIEDAATYRTTPCLTWVATGSCPFGKRCASIHDPRIIGPCASWLPHTETQGNSMSTDINVDGLHQKRLNAITHNNPFGEHFSLDMDHFADLYKLVCNTTPNKRRRNQLSEIHKIAIALEMRGGPDWMYKYRPQHVIYEELCMVLQKRAFCLEKSGKVSSIPINSFSPRNSQHVLVREIAFGPDSDSTVRGVALWFNIPENEVSECTPQQAKRFRWRRKPNFDDKRALEKLPSVFESRECFAMIRPFDRDAFDLASNILNHRHETLKAERLSTLSERFESLKELQKQKDDLQETFQNHRRGWINWAWPINVGRQCIDHDTSVPPVDGQYTPLLDEEALEKALFEENNDEKEPIKGAAIEPVWNSFVSTCLDIKASNAENALPRQETHRHRLTVFAKLANGEEICPNRNLPHITSSYPLRSICVVNNHHRTAEDTPPILRRQSEQCWKALMLKNEDVALSSKNEWEIVRDHFQNARCKKVLTILQN